MAAGVLLLVLASLLALLVVGLQQKAALSVRRTLIVEARLSHVQTLASDAESAQRGFLMTGRLDYLEPYLTARRELAASLSALKAENAGSVEALSDLDGLLGQKMGELQKTIDLRQAGRNAEALAIVNTNTGARLMAAIRNGIDRMRSTEASYLEHQSDNAAFLSELAQEVLMATLVLLLGLGFLGLRDSRHRILELRSANTALEFEAAERRSAEAQLRQLQKMEAVGQLTGGIAHDFNNMLAIVIGFLDLARRRLGAADPSILKYIDNATDGANRAVLLTKRLLAFSRQQPLQPTVIDVNKQVGGMSELLHRATGEAVLMETVLAAGLWRVHADAAQIENALVNLAVNARDAMPDGGRLTIETSNADLDERYAAAHNEVVAGQYVMISVTDTGAGMSASVLERAVDPFYTTKGIGKGTGLGLSQVFGFVKQSGGHLKLYSEVGQGTTAKIYLPRHRGNAAVVHEVEEVGLPQRGQATEVILVVEDDANVKLMTVEALGELGYTVVVADSPQQALRLIEERPDTALLFTDVVMPGMNGRQLAQAALALVPSLRVLYTTGYTRNAIVHHGIVDEGTAFLAKPFTINELATKIRRTLDA